LGLKGFVVVVTLVIKIACFAHVTLAFVLIKVGPKNGDYMICTFLQGAKPGSWKEKLSSNAFARKVISKYSFRGHMNVRIRNTNYFEAFYANSIIFFCDVASIFTNCG